ncbi:nucleosomal histone kinase 1 [Drosophila sulfurigaster albostrigata]|uniref:nucleosomal histone kinase 1 n=1 Tax=Drosophila sulfurigaster albostrigata TaxID=89887 RepID=UPI002D21AD5B|nr:nucleosomal histone kinase 1 [Drosophila sulfurigaster albostrigata]
MPRAAKPKAAPAKKAKGKLYAMPEKIKEGTILTDLAKGQWRIGPSIGIGGFGEIYAACRNGEKNYDAVVKCEPHGNGPLFVEMHFYLRNAKLEEIKQFQKQRKLKSLGMPNILANGSSDINGQKHRFIVMPRYGSDIYKFYVQNGNRLPEATIYRLALQMLDVYQFIHNSGYVHADLKAANILLGHGKNDNGQAYLVDFGLASHFVTGDFKPDPRKMHNGTIEYTSRDAHLGVPTRRSDLEILGYNLIEWMGVELPWVKQKLLAVPVKVQQAKETFMNDVNASLKALFPKGVPAAIGDYMKYVVKLTHNEQPDYDKCREWFANALKQMKVANSGDLDFALKPQSNNNNNSPPVKKTAAKRKKEAADEELEENADQTPRGRQAANKAGAKAKPSPKLKKNAAADDNLEENVDFTPRGKVAAKKAQTAAKPSPKIKKEASVVSLDSSDDVILDTDEEEDVDYTPRRKLAANKAVAAAGDSSSLQRGSPKKRVKLDTNGTPKAPTPAPAAASSAKLNFSPMPSMRGRAGKTLINDDLTPQPRSNKTYEFNFELDVSMDANVIVNVKRKKKGGQSSSKVSNGTSGTPSRTPNKDSPATRVNLRKVTSDISTPNSASRKSPRTPAVTVRKFRH